MKPKIIKLKDYQKNEDIIYQIKKLIEPFYSQAGDHIDHDIETCDELYVVNSDEGRIIAFLMVGFHFIDDMPCYYAGLSACKDELKNTGVVSRLYFEFSKDCVHQESKLKERVIIYWTTATPIVYYFTNYFLKNVQPTISGKCTEEGKQVLETIANKQYTNAKQEDSAPYVLRNAAEQITYSTVERNRLKKAVKDLNLTVFDDYEIDEANGDRFLMFGYAPSLEEINERVNKR